MTSVSNVSSQVPLQTSSNVASTAPASTDPAPSPGASSPGASIASDASNVNAQANSPGALDLDGVALPPSPHLQDAIKQAKAEKDKVDAHLDKAVDAFKSQLSDLKQLGNQLQFAQGGDVDRITPNRGQRFDANVKVIEKLLGEKPVNATEVTAHLNNLKTLLSPPATPLGPDGKSRLQTFFGPPVPGAEKALALIDTMHAASGTEQHHDPGSLWAVQTHALAAQHKLTDLKEIQKDGPAVIQKLDDQVKAHEQRLANEQARYAKDHAELLKQRDAAAADFEKSLATDGADGTPSLKTLLAGDKSPGGQEALADLAAAENAMQLGRDHAAAEFLQKLKNDLANFPDSPTLAALAKDKTLQRLIGEAHGVEQIQHKTHEVAVAMHDQEMRVAGLRRGLRGAEEAMLAPPPVAQPLATT